MADFYHIYISPKPGVSPEQVEDKMNLAIDWFRYDDKNWIVYTKSDSRKWFARFKSFVEPNGRIFICKLDVKDNFGLMSKELWPWLRRENTSKNKGK